MKISNAYNMNKKDLKKLSKSELINLLLKQEKKPKPVPTPRKYKSVKDMVQQYEDNIIIPAPEFRDDHKPFQHQELKNQFLKKELSFHKLKKH